jgi:hypothetical protein
MSGGFVVSGPSVPRHVPHSPRLPDTLSFVHLIPSDLWEAITGEKVTPTNICQMFNYSMPMSDRPGPQHSPQSLQDIQFVLMSKDRQGSRVLQNRLETGSPADVSSIFDALYPNLGELVSDQAANFVIHKLCDVITPQQQDRLLSFFFDDILGIIDHPISCRVLQKFIETTSKANVITIYQATKPKLLSLCLSQNGNHIVQRFIDILPEKIQEIIFAIQPHLIQLAVDNCGCRVVQRLFDGYNVDVLVPLVTEVLKYASDLATNQYGNYVVQNILQAKRPDHVGRLVASFRGHFYEFSIHKFASNVIEKCIRGASRDDQLLIFTEIIGDEERYDERRIVTMVSDQFGNYVIQRIIEYGTDGQKNAIYEVVYDNYDRLCGINYAAYVITKLENMGFQF